MVVDGELQSLRLHALDYLLGAGWSADEKRGAASIAMQHVSATRRLALDYEPVEGFVRLEIAFRSNENPGWLFRRGAVTLRIFLVRDEVLGLLCRLTSSQDGLHADSVMDWIEELVSLYPETYAVLAQNASHDVLARVVRTGEKPLLH